MWDKETNKFQISVVSKGLGSLILFPKIANLFSWEIGMRHSWNIILRAQEMAGLLYSHLKKSLRLCNGLHVWLANFLINCFQVFSGKGVCLDFVEAVWWGGGVHFWEGPFPVQFFLVQDRDAVLNARLWCVKQTSLSLKMAARFAT